jgi:hypothetical protein
VQSPSSLIFLALLGVWAAYFAQYWLRRRDHLATARSVEQFSEAMRVLERRPALPRTDLAEPAPRSSAVQAARTAQPHVLGKRAVASEPAVAGVSERIAPESRSGRGTSPLPNARGDRPARRGTGRDRPRRVRPSRRVRGLTLLTTLLALLTVGPLVALFLLPVWALAPAVVAVVAAFFWVRSAVRAERALRRARIRRPAEGRRAAGPPRGETAVAAQDAAGDVVGDAAVGAVGGAAGAVSGGAAEDAAAADRHTADAGAAPVIQGEGPEVEQPAEVGARPGADRVETVPVVAAEVMVPIVDEDDIPLTWDPVPVPRPTYTMKAKAERPEVAPAATTPQPVRHEESGEDTAYDERRVAGA